MEPQSATPSYTFATTTALALEACFDDGHLTSDGGLPWLAKAEDGVGVCAALAACVPEWRRLHIHHLIERLVRQQVFQMACGYEYQNDADTLRGDPFITALLLPGNAHANRGVLSVLCVLVPLLRTRWPGVAIKLRADSGCAVPAL